MFAGPEPVGDGSWDHLVEELVGLLLDLVELLELDVEGVGLDLGRVERHPQLNLLLRGRQHDVAGVVVHACRK